MVQSTSSSLPSTVPAQPRVALTGNPHISTLFSHAPLYPPRTHPAVPTPRCTFLSTVPTRPEAILRAVEAFRAASHAAGE